jgi:hypothetical protein
VACASIAVSVAAEWHHRHLAATRLAIESGGGIAPAPAQKQIGPA